MEISQKSLKLVNTHMIAAEAYAQLSRATRKKVGAVLLNDNRIISVGYNGNVAGGNNKVEDNVGGEMITRPEVIHAEMNCIAFAAKTGVATKDTTLVITHSPCFNCCKLLIQAGVTRVYYRNLGRHTEGLLFLQDNGIPVIQV